MGHPNWYYKLYEQIFAWNINYLDNLNKIDQRVHIKNSVIKEIGSGTGNYIDSLLLFDPEKIIALDNDWASIQILNKKYGEHKNINVIYCDGFKSNIVSNITICFYCIIQQTTDIATLCQRIKNLQDLSALNQAAVFIEIIDTEKHYPHDKIRIFECNTDYLDILSYKETHGVSICYDGIIWGKKAFYIVPIHECPIDLFTCDKRLKKFENIPLNSSGRKRMIYLQY